jgi:UDP-N-acetylmuramoylalanine--D-glutamate ligase
MNSAKFELKNKKVVVFGMGVSGISALRFLSLLGANCFAVNSHSPENWAKSPGVLDYTTRDNCFSEEEAHEKSVFLNIDLVILSPGIPRDHYLLKIVHDNEVPIWGELELAYRYLEATQKLKPIIGITGTNGKTTTTTFLGEMIKADHKKVFVGGNIGTPLCDYTSDIFLGGSSVDYILLELSSFQLESIDHFHVNIAIILNIFQNHGERYHRIEDYAQSKFFITNRFDDNDVLIYPENFEIISNWAQRQKGKKLTINTENLKINRDLSQFKLPGLHNKVNLSFILHVTSELGLSEKAIASTISHFPGVHHRVEFISPSRHIPKFKIYNDAKSTNWDATLTAVKAMEEINGNLYLIIGGKKRGHGDSILPYLEFFSKRVHTFFLIGEMAVEIEQEIRGKVNYVKTDTLLKTVEYLEKFKSNEDGILLFSPGFPSFDQFKNYAQRGEHFVALLHN